MMNRIYEATHVNPFGNRSNHRCLMGSQAHALAPPGHSNRRHDTLTFHNGSWFKSLISVSILNA